MIRELVLTSSFRRDLKRERKTDRQIDALLKPVLNDLARDRKLDLKYRDHALTGNFKPYRECHIKPDLLLIYDCPDDEQLVLIRLGSHAELDL